MTAYGFLYLEVNIISVAIVGIIRYRTLGLSRMNAQRNFSMALDSEMLLFISDTFCLMVEDRILPVPGWMLLAGKLVYFMATALTCYFWFIYFELLMESRFAKSRRLILLSTGLVSAMGVMQLVNLFTGVLFGLDAGGSYVRGPLFWLQYLFSYTYILFSCTRALLASFKKENLTKRRLLCMLALFPVAPAIAGLVQFRYPMLPLVCVVLALETLTIYLQWLDRMISVDPLTRLNNRKQLEYHYRLWMQSPENDNTLYLLLVDANKFKSINDTYGHTEGDAALVRIADAMRLGCKDYPRRANIARYGGDEFVILARADSTEEVRELSRLINSELERLNREANAPYDVSVSIGIAKAEATLPLKELIAQADRELYEEKEKLRR